MGIRVVFKLCYVSLLRLPHSVRNRGSQVNLSMPSGGRPTGRSGAILSCLLRHGSQTLQAMGHAIKVGQVIC